MSSSGKMPKDAAVMAAILKEAGITAYDPRVVNQMLEFTYRYITNVLEDARVYCSHAKKKNIDIEDVRLAVQMQLDQRYTTPPPRDLLAEVARGRNSQPLPTIKPQSGLRLPPDRYCLTATNYRLKLSRKPQRQLSVGGPGSGGGRSAGGAHSRGTKVAVVPNKPASSGGTGAVQMAVPKFKVQTESAAGGAPTPAVMPRIQFSTPTSDPTLAGLKRKREDDQ